MPFLIYDYVNLNGQNEFKQWTVDLQKKQRVKLNEKIDKLELYGDGLYPHMLSGTSVAGIQKLRVRGNVELRPLLCHGPINIKNEFTLLMGSKEVGDELVPKDAASIADSKKSEVIKEPTKRRAEHEKILQSPEK